MSKSDYKYLLMKMNRPKIEEVFKATFILVNNPILKKNQEAGRIFVELIIMLAIASQDDEAPTFAELLVGLYSQKKADALLEDWQSNFPELRVRFSASCRLAAPDRDDVLALLEFARTHYKHPELKQLLDLIRNETALAPYAMTAVADPSIKANASIHPTAETAWFLDWEDEYR